MTQKPQKPTEKKSEEENPLTSIQVTKEFKASLDELPGETYQEKIQGLIAQNAAMKEAIPEKQEGMVHLILPEKTYRQTLMLVPTQTLSLALQRAKVS